MVDCASKLNYTIVVPGLFGPVAVLACGLVSSCTGCNKDLNRGTGSRCQPWARESRSFASGSAKNFACLYVAKFAEAIYVLHAFEKKSQKTAQRDLAVAAERLGQLIRTREGR